MTASAARTKRASAIGVILLAGIIAGTLDIAAAGIHYFIKSGKGPGNVLRYIASGLFGSEAFKGGTGMAALGLLLHYLIAFIFTVFFFWFYPSMKFLSHNKVVSGLAYGFFVWLAMNLIVVPLSYAPSAPIDWAKVGIPILILMFCVGLPISLIIGKYYDSVHRNR